MRRVSIGGGNAVDASHAAGSPHVTARVAAGSVWGGLPAQVLSTGDGRRRHGSIIRLRDGRVNDLITGRRHGSFELRFLLIQLLILLSCLLLLLLFLQQPQIRVRLWLQAFVFSRVLVLLVLLARRAAARACSGLLR